MNDPITTIEFNRLLHMAVDKYNLDPSNTYVEFTWWDNGKFRPLICADCDRKKNQFIMVFGDDFCNVRWKNEDGYIIPTGFYIWKEAKSINQVAHRPLTVSKLLDSEFMLEFEIVGFLFSNSPINYWVDINPFKTRIYKNNDGETILSFYAEDRDSGEWQSFSNLTSNSIKQICES